ncbi:MAG: 3-deoxy-7-phosphoheptulonate synthase [Erysipelotrichaceae bacterium]|nr:3-deoxy-7-phosphoheptulonate synthase [Erysipelotrichaceae bacterium]
MIITFKPHTPPSEINKIRTFFIEHHCELKDVSLNDNFVFGVIGDTTNIDPKWIEANTYVSHVTRLNVPYKKVSRQLHPEDTVIEVKGIKIGGNHPLVMIAGPCSIEGRESTLLIAENVQKCGAHILRGGAYKPRTSPYTFQGLGSVGIQHMVEAREKTGMPIISELMSTEKLDEFLENVDIIQIGARNMQNFELLKAVGKVNKPVLLKRGISNTMEEWFMSAEYIMSEGNEQVILCERGIRTFEKYTRNTLDLSTIPLVKQLTHLPIIIDPSHATGNRDLVESMSLAAVAAGADGIMVEVHNDPEKAWSDGAQTLTFDAYKEMVEKCHKIATVIGRE